MLAARTDPSTSEDEARELDDSSEDDFDLDNGNNECVGCGKNFDLTKQKVETGQNVCGVPDGFMKLVRHLKTYVNHAVKQF